MRRRRRSPASEFGPDWRGLGMQCWVGRSCQFRAPVGRARARLVIPLDLRLRVTGGPRGSASSPTSLVGRHAKQPRDRPTSARLALRAVGR